MYLLYSHLYWINMNRLNPVSYRFPPFLIVPMKLTFNRYTRNAYTFNRRNYLEITLFCRRYKHNKSIGLLQPNICT